MTNPYENLANAIIVQACDDYRTYHKQLKELKKSEPENGDAKVREKYEKKEKALKADIKEVLDFFHSGWFSQLTAVDPDIILNRLKKECDNA